MTLCNLPCCSQSEWPEPQAEVGLGSSAASAADGEVEAPENGAASAAGSSSYWAGPSCGGGAVAAQSGRAAAEQGSLAERGLESA